MSNFFTIWRREFTACFLSPIAYVTLVAFLAMCGGTFMYGVLRNAGTEATVSNLLFAAVLLWLPLLISVISMRLFAEEKRSGTIETLLTAPVSDAEVVLGKYAGALTFLLLAALPAVANVFVLAAFSPAVSIETIDPGALTAGGAMLILESCFFLAVGILVSLLTSNQIVSAICSFCAIWLILLCGNIVSTLPVESTSLAEFISPFTHMDDFSRGSIDSRPIVLYVSGTVFILFASVRMLEARKWK